MVRYQTEKKSESNDLVCHEHGKNLVTITIKSDQQFETWTQSETNQTVQKHINRHSWQHNLKISDGQPQPEHKRNQQRDTIKHQRCAFIVTENPNTVKDA